MQGVMKGAIDGRRCSPRLQATYAHNIQVGFLSVHRSFNQHRGGTYRGTRVLDSPSGAPHSTGVFGPQSRVGLETAVMITPRSRLDGICDNRAVVSGKRRSLARQNLRKSGRRQTRLSRVRCLAWPRSLGQRALRDTMRMRWMTPSRKRTCYEHSNG